MPQSGFMVSSMSVTLSPGTMAAVLSIVIWTIDPLVHMHLAEPAFGNTNRRWHENVPPRPPAPYRFAPWSVGESNWVSIWAPVDENCACMTRGGGGSTSHSHGMCVGIGDGTGVGSAVGMGEIDG